ncbi:MAG: alpha/beta hydrolase family protein [Actinomycetota bacterium]
MVATCVAFSLLALPGGGHTAPDPCPLGLTVSSNQHPPGGVPFVICSGRIATFDGTPLDVDLSLPARQATPMPLMVMLHGWGGDKTNWESPTLEADGRDKYHWNNAWFASRGFAVLTYSAHGFHRSCGKDPATGYSYATDPECSGHPGQASWTHLSDRRWEIRDSQHLVGLLVDAGIARANRIVVTGGSYGGGQSWLLALSDGRIMLPDGSTVPWTSPKGVPIRLTAAIPKYPWTDLAQSLVDNGRGSGGAPGVPEGSHTDPIGVEKKSYVDGLYALGQAPRSTLWTIPLPISTGGTPA